MENEAQIDLETVLPCAGTMSRIYAGCAEPPKTQTQRTLFEKNGRKSVLAPI
jgi:hypothetical protein